LKTKRHDKGIFAQRTFLPNPFLCLRGTLQVERQKALPVVYDEVKLDAGYRIDLLVNNTIILELKSVEAIINVHKAQLMTYLKLAKINVGYLINFNVESLKEGILRMVV
jgi:GxxExxY protein